MINAYAFSGCSSLTEVSLPESLTTMYGGLFEGTQIRTLTIPPNVSKCIKERVKYPLTGCTELETVIFADGTEAIADYICYESSVKNIVMPDTVTSIGASAFANTEISEAVIPEGIQTIGSYAFGGCANLESFVWPETITEIPSSVFSSCTALTSFVIPEGVTAIGSSAFSGCTGLVSCELPDGLKEIGSDAFFKSGLENIVIPDSVELIEHYAFMNCKNLKNVEFAVSDQVLPGIKNMTMSEVADDDLDTHTMTIGWELYRTQTMEIEYQAFDSCTGLTLITLSNSLQTIFG